MKKEYVTNVVVNCSHEKVWEVLSQLEKWPQWTSTVTSVERVSGAGLGACYKVKQPGLPASKLTVMKWRDGESFTWESNEAAAKMVALHNVVAINESTSRVELSVVMSGPLVRIVWMLWGQKIRSYTDREAASLKVAVESLPS